MQYKKPWAFSCNCARKIYLPAKAKKPLLRIKPAGIRHRELYKKNKFFLKKGRSTFKNPQYFYNPLRKNAQKCRAFLPNHLKHLSTTGKKERYRGNKKVKNKFFLCVPEIKKVKNINFFMPSGNLKSEKQDFLLCPRGNKEVKRENFLCNPETKKNEKEKLFMPSGK